MLPPKGTPVQAASNEWKKGPLPPNTYFWGGAVVSNDTSGFQFADFCGDHVKLDTRNGWLRVEPADVKMYNNCLTLPPEVTNG